MGKPDCVKRNRLIKKVSREPGEVKHLSTRRKRKQCQCFTLAHSLSSGERKGKSPNRIHNLLCIRGCKKITSGAKHIIFICLVPEGEHLDKSWLGEISWKGIP